MKERAESNLGTVKLQAEFIDMNHENQIWAMGVLGEDSPVKLHNTVLFLLGINLGLRAGNEHYDLRRDSKSKPSQLTFERSSDGQCCLVYREDSVTKTNDGGLNSLTKDRKVVWVFSNKDINWCTVHLVDKYMSLLPPVGPKTKKLKFYLHALEKPNAAQWFGEQVVGHHTLTKVVGELLKSAHLDGYFTNHSLLSTSTTWLFRAGIDRRVITEFTGYSSDAVDNYQVTSKEQKKQISAVMKTYLQPLNQKCSWIMSPEIHWK